MADTNTQIFLSELPTDKLREDHFAISTAPIPEPADGEVLVETAYLSLDAANRAWMQGATYTDALTAGSLMRGFVLGRVLASNSPDFAEGDIVECESGWQTHGVHRAADLGRVRVRGPLSHHVSALGVTGLTAYFGLLEIGDPQPGETVLVSAAAGATGNVVGQIAAIKGCRVVGVAGSDAKCAFLTDELGFAAAVDHRSDDFRRALKEACPDGVDVYFDNTGGAILAAALFRMNERGRIVCCGVVSQYDTANPEPGPPGVPGLIVTKRLRMQGFIVMDHFARREGALDELAGWIDEGRLQVVEDVLEGIEAAPAGLVGLLAGDNVGKRMVRVAG